MGSFRSIHDPRHAGQGHRYALHILLFLATLFCTTWAGTYWIGTPAEMTSPAEFLENLKDGLPFSLPLLAFLSVHEFGHYFATVIHRIRATLPYYIPVPPLPFLLSIGTMGAVIRIQEPIPDTESLLDTGASGPIAGFVIAFFILLYGFLNVPPTEYLYGIHPEYLKTGGVPAIPPPGTLYLGKNLLFVLLETVIAPKELPPMTELYHYPFLFTGWLACFVTALNLLPVGQLDGGHVVYAMFGDRGHALIARTFLFLITMAGLPAFSASILELAAPELVNLVPHRLIEWSWPGWILWSFILTKLIGLSHPQVMMPMKLTPKRRIAGWLCIVIFVLTFTPVPFGII
ncbi:MAG: site-2 protease family protein [Chlorobiaceae bacterium]|nr:site-2 protease family protein [Chlorobiaceae bacterium]NTV25852.1 site-2 protease family protein [Chlorobiaceae bacterium]